MIFHIRVYINGNKTRVGDCAEGETMMMKKKEKTMFLAVLGLGLQAAGGICTMAAAVAVMTEIKQKMKKIILKELHKQLETV